MAEQPPADMTAPPDLLHGTVGELRGLLSVPAGADEAGYERAGYVTALRAANSHVGPW
jgi:hypothetical protein